MTQNEMAALLIGLMVFAMVWCLGMDTLPSGRRITPLARRALDSFDRAVENIFGKGGY